MTKLKNSNWEETQIKLWKSSKTKFVHKLWQKLKTHIVTKLKTSNCYKTQKNKLWQNSNQIVTKLKNSNCAQIGTKLKNSNWDKTQLKLWQKTQILLNSKTQIVTVLLVTLVTVAVVTVVIVTSLRKTWHLDNRWNVLCAAFRDSRDVYIGVTAMKFEFVQIVRKVWYTSCFIILFYILCYNSVLYFMLFYVIGGLNRPW